MQSLKNTTSGNKILWFSKRVLNGRMQCVKDEPWLRCHLSVKTLQETYS